MNSIFEQRGGTYTLGADGMLYPNLILSGKLYRHMAELNDQAQARLEVIIQQMQCSEGVNERMKAQDQMLWVGRMNSIRNRAEEIILAELIFI